MHGFLARQSTSIGMTDPHCYATMGGVEIPRRWDAILCELPAVAHNGSVEFV